MIQRIEKIDNYRVFHDYHWPSDLADFNKYNLIYGWNGSGKTALSSIFRAIELQQSSALDGISLKIDDRISPAQELNGSAVPIKVFNRDFIQDSVFPVGGGELAHIFILGKESVEKQKEVQRLEAELEKAQLKESQISASYSRHAKALDAHCRDRAFIIKEKLRSAGSNDQYANYNKANFQNKAEELLEHEDIGSLILDDKQYTVREAELRDNPKKRIPALKLPVIKFETINENISKLLGKTVVSCSIESLKDNPALSAWVQSGLKIHKDSESTICQFCGQPLPPARIEELNGHFNIAYNKLMQDIDKTIDDINKIKTELDRVILPVVEDFYAEYKIEFNSSGIKEEKESAVIMLRNWVTELEAKKDDMFNRIVLKSFKSPRLDIAEESCVSAISHHNVHYDEYEQHRASARSIIEKHLVALEIEEYTSNKNALMQSKNELQGKQSYIKDLKCQIAKLRQDILQYHKPADDFNEDLHSYLGHNEIQLETKDAGYQIIRGGVAVDGLSEGEKTAIALLYFLRTFDDKDFNLQNGIVVLDDPISSLDANALFSAFGFIKARTKNAKQLFILTHNFTFFSQVRNWFKHVKKDKKIGRNPVAFYMLKCLCDGQQRKSVIEELDSLLKEYNSEYHYLFWCVHKASISEPNSDLQKNYMLPNHARRVIEAFLAFRQPNTYGLSRKFQDVEFDEYKKVRILRFVHTFSHNDSIAEPERDPSLLGKSQEILSDMIEMMTAVDSEHVKSMIESFVNKA